MKKTFLLGVGAQKAGTTWLYRHLQRQPGVRFGLRKEMHFFDAATVPEFAGIRTRMVRAAMLQSARRVLARGIGVEKDIAEPLETISFYRNDQNYFEYFARLLDSEGTTLVGDITPNYAALSGDTLEHIRRNFERRGIRVHALFIIRDPVERYLSDCAMMYRRPLRHRRPRLFERAGRFVRRMIAQPQMELKGRYERTIRNLETAFDAEDVTVEFYERLFTPERFAPIMHRLGLSYCGADFNVREFAGRRLAISPDMRTAIASHYQATYEFMCERYGHELVHDLWKSACPFGKTN